MMSAGHAFLPPSSASRWEQCAASPMMEAAYPDEDSEHARDGTAAHWASSETLSNGGPIMSGVIAPNGVIVTDEMLEACAVYVDAVTERRVANGLDVSELHIEERITIPRIHEHCWGTPDCWFADPVTHILEIFDFKYGHGYVDEFENWQLIAYVCGIIDQLGVNGGSDDKWTVRMHIIQPRCYSAAPVRTWQVMAVQLRAYFNGLAMAAKAAFAPQPVATVGPECVYCKARHVCQALQQDAYRSARIARSSLPVELPPAAIGLELHFLRQAADQLNARISGLEAQAVALMQRGERVPFHAMKPSLGRMEWARDVGEVLALGDMLGVSLAKPGAITPTQAIKAGLPEELVTQYATRKSTIKIVPDDGREARKVFGSC